MRDWLTIELVLGTVLVASFTSIGLLALWAATSPRHWFFRAAGLLAAISPLMLVPAYEPLIVFALQACFVVAGSRVWHWRRGEGNRELLNGDVTSNRRLMFRFSLGTLLLITPLVAAITAMATRIAANLPPLDAEVWREIALNGAGSGCAVLLGVWMFVSNRKWIAWPAALVLCLGLAAVMGWFDSLFTIAEGYQGGPPRAPVTVPIFGFTIEADPALAWLAVMPAIAAGIWLLVFIWLAGARTAAVAGECRRCIALRCAFCLLVALLAIPPTFLLWGLLHCSPNPNFPAPQPNGLDDIVAAGKDFGTSPMLSTVVEPQSTEQLAAEVAKYAGAYQRLRLGLSREIQLRPWPQDGDLMTAFTMSLGDLQQVRSAARGLMREAELAQQQSRYANAARIALDNIRLGHAVTRDGLLTEYLLGLAVDDIGKSSLYQALPQLDAGECRETTVALVEVERRRESLEDVLHRERIWSEHVDRWFGHFFLLLSDITSTDDRHEPVRRADRRTRAVTRLLITELGLRAFQLERGELPDRLEQLTPKYLAEVPVDPFDPGGRPLRYARTDEGHVVYSVGADGKDDGGRPPGQNEHGWRDPFGDGDLRLDVQFPSGKTEGL